MCTFYFCHQLNNLSNLSKKWRRRRRGNAFLVSFPTSPVLPLFCVGEVRSVLLSVSLICSCYITLTYLVEWLSVCYSRSLWATRYANLNMCLFSMLTVLAISIHSFVQLYILPHNKEWIYISKDEATVWCKESWLRSEQCSWIYWHIEQRRFPNFKNYEGPAGGGGRTASTRGSSDNEL